MKFKKGVYKVVIIAALASVGAIFTNTALHNNQTYVQAAKKYLFTVATNDSLPKEGQVYRKPNEGPIDTWVGGISIKVYEEKADNTGAVWYRIGKNEWLCSYDTNKPKGPNIPQEVKDELQKAAEAKARSGWKKVNGKYHYYDTEGKMLRVALVGNYLIDRNGNRHHFTVKKTGNQVADAKRVAKVIAKWSTGRTQLERVDMAAYYVSLFSDRDRYTMKGPYYNKAYGVFVAKEYSCAGSTDALCMVLQLMGFKAEHVNKNAYTHQWCKLKMDGRVGYADGQAGFANYGSYFTKKNKYIMTPENSIKAKKWNDEL